MASLDSFAAIAAGLPSRVVANAFRARCLAYEEGFEVTEDSLFKVIRMLLPPSSVVKW